MAVFKVEKGVPAPKRHHRMKYPFREMEVGDSFFVPLTSTSGLPSTLRSNISASARSVFGQSGRIETKTVEESGVLGFRVWLVRDPNDEC